jgi:hypothetical protein
MFASLFANRAAPPVTDTYFTVSFVTGTPPTNIVLHADYTGPATPAQALYDAGDGVWRAYTANNITMRGDRRYLKLRGDWRTAAGTYKGMFKSALAGAAYTCEFTGTLDYAATAASAYREIFRDCTKVTQIRDNPFQPIRGSPAASMFNSACSGMSGVTGSLPAGFMNTSGLTGSPAASMFANACIGMSGVTGSLPAGFLDTSGLTGSPAASMFYAACDGMSGVSGALPTGFLDTSGLTGSPAASMFYAACRSMSGVTGSLPTGFLDTSGLTGSPAANMFYYSCSGMSGVTGSLPSGFLDTSGLTGSPAANMFLSACNGMSKIASGDFNISANVTLTSANVVGPLTSAWRGMPLWTGQVYWGTNVIHTVLTPDSDINTFANNTSMPGYATLNANWK